MNERTNEPMDGCLVRYMAQTQGAECQKNENERKENKTKTSGTKIFPFLPLHFSAVK